MVQVWNVLVFFLQVMKVLGIDNFDNNFTQYRQDVDSSVTEVVCLYLLLFKEWNYFTRI